MSARDTDLPLDTAAFFDAAPCGFLIVAPDWHIRGVNETFASWSGRSKAELVGVHMRDLLDVAGRIFFDTHFAPLIRLQGAFHEVALNIKRPDGTRMATLVNAAERTDDHDTVQALLVTVFNATDRRRYEDELVTARNDLRELNERLEERVRDEVEHRLAAEASLRQVQKMEAVGALSGGIAHDFNNILQIVSANLGLAAKRSGPDAQEHLANARAGVARGAKLAQQLLAFGRDKPASTEVVDAVAVLDGMRDMIDRTLSSETSVRFELVDDELLVDVDASQLENAILNLAINARDAMAKTGRERVLTVSVKPMPDEVGSQLPAIELAVADTGEGMAPDTIAKVFEPFFTTKPAGKGTGLGLAMVYGFARQSGGTVDIDSTPGEGTRIAIRLPQTAKPRVAQRQEAMAPTQGGAETVLLVEHSDDIRTSTKGLLEDLGYTVLDARDAEAGHEHLTGQGGVDLVIFNLVQRSANGSTSAVPRRLIDAHDGALLLTSGHADEFDEELDRTVELLRKPYDQIALASAVRRALGSDGSPVVQDADAQVAQPIDPAAASGRARSILLVEDEFLIRASTAMQLEDLGHTVVEAGSAEEALDHLGCQQIDILMTDLGLPAMSGEDLARTVRSTHPDIGIVFVTGADDLPILDGEPTARLDKPFGDRDLRDALKAVGGPRP